VLIIGAGQAGVPLARELAKRGKRVGLAERKHLGGSCVNFGCTPTKAVIASARVAHLARRGAEFGLDIPRIAWNRRSAGQLPGGLQPRLGAHLAGDGSSGECETSG
jgi:pyruvate/2-oxoglutarate dehydrogenase complex dihydrolipoamide dehydrogenase (E3) component